MPLRRRPFRLLRYPTQLVEQQATSSAPPTLMAESNVVRPSWRGSSPKDASVPTQSGGPLGLRWTATATATPYAPKCCGGSAGAAKRRRLPASLRPELGSTGEAIPRGPPCWPPRKCCPHSPSRPQLSLTSFLRGTRKHPRHQRALSKQEHNEHRRDRHQCCHRKLRSQHRADRASRRVER